MSVASAWAAPASASVTTPTVASPSACAVRATRIAISPRLAIRTGLSSRMGLPLDRAGDQRVRAQRAAEDVAHRPGGVEQARQVDAGGDPHLVQHRDEVLGGDVARRAGGHRAAAQLAEA